jgi:predicted nucleic acid-binding protein
VVDASIATKWYLRDEADIEAADRVLDDLQSGQTLLIAPNQIRYEVASAVRNALRTGRETPSRGRRAIAGFLALPISTVDTDLLIEAGYDFAVRFGCSLYDGLYLALAELTGAPFVHADRRLRNTIGTSFPLAVWVDNYP